MKNYPDGIDNREPCISDSICSEETRQFHKDFESFYGMPFDKYIDKYALGKVEHLGSLGVLKTEVTYDLEDIEKEYIKDLMVVK